MVTGLDLVELMLRVAAGERLPISQEDARPKGWAMRMRMHPCIPHASCACRMPHPVGQLLDAHAVCAGRWAFECRVYAEDPLRGFLPSVGTLSTYRPPQTAPCVAAASAASAAAGGAEVEGGVVRVDDGVVEGGEISVHYDPMIAKLITHAPSREAARLLTLQVG